MTPAPLDYSFEHDVIDRLARIEEHITPLQVAFADHEARVRVIEKRQGYMAGVIGLVVFVAPWLTHFSFFSK